jgi:hypothetical protein
MRRNEWFAFSLLLGLTACGGGGGDGGGSVGGAGGGGSTRSPVPPQTALTYSGNTMGAAVSATSASTLSSNVIGSSGAAMGSSLLTGVSAQADAAPNSEPQSTGAIGLAQRLAKAMRAGDLAPAGASGALAGATINQSTPCDSGSINISGQVADNTGTGTVTADFVDCRTGSDTLNGPASLNITGFDQTNRIVTDGTLSFTRVRFTGPGINMDLTGSLRVQVNANGSCAWASSCAIETLTAQNIITQDNNTGRQTSTPNLRIVNSFASVTGPTYFTQSIDGRVCDGTAGCVDVTTETAAHTAPWGPLYYATHSQLFPDWGIINLAGATGRVRITSLGSALAKVEVDADGNSIYENSARLQWFELGTALGTDLADSDGDGMHNSWETAHGLNAGAPDGGIDADGDGYDNLTEYLRGSDPSTTGSTPGPVRHLWYTDVSGLAVDGTGQIQVFDSGTSGVLLNPVTAELGAPFTAGTPSATGTSVTDVGGRTFTLSQPAGAPATTWVLTNVNTGATLTINSVAGTSPGSLIRYGAHGLAFRTIGAASPGYVYLVESAQLVP